MSEKDRKIPRTCTRTHDPHKTPLARTVRRPLVYRLRCLNFFIDKIGIKIPAPKLVTVGGLYVKKFVRPNDGKTDLNQLPIQRMKTNLDAQKTTKMRFNHHAHLRISCPYVCRGQ